MSGESEATKEARWFVLLSTSPSGKTLFVCKVCGSKSIAPDKDCPVRPTFSTGGGAEDIRVGLTCREVWDMKDDPAYSDMRTVVREYKHHIDELADEVNRQQLTIRELELLLAESKLNKKNPELEKLADQVAGIMQRRWAEQLRKFGEAGLHNVPLVVPVVSEDGGLDIF